MKRFLKKLSNRGSTFVIVITTIGFVGAITSLVLMVTSSGYQTKAIDNQAKNNFYSAEEIVDQIKTGLHNDMSKAIMESYFATLTTYYEDNFANENDSNKRKEELAKVDLQYKQNAVGDSATGTGFIGMVQDGLGSGKVSKTVLEGYISDVYRDSKDDNVDIIIGAQKKEGASNDITIETNVEYEYDPFTGTSVLKEYGVVIRNIGITYVNELGYTNNVYTDIKMNVPSLDLSYIDLDRNIDFARYGIMAKNDVNLSEGRDAYASAIIGNFWVGKNLNITGGARLKALADYGYIGEDLNLNVNANTKTAVDPPTNGYTRDSMFEMNILTGPGGYYTYGLNHTHKNQVGVYTTTNFKASSKLYSLRDKTGNALKEKNADDTAYRKMFQNSTSEIDKISMVETYLAVDDILMNDATVGGTNTNKVNTINTDTNLLVKNDMLFNVDYAHADIRNMYHGYGYANDRISAKLADHNSSIILNNKNCNLEMKLRGLSILGSAFIKTNATDTTYAFPYAASDVLTGDSLIVRGNQIAYLVPAKFIPGFKTNPVTSAEAGGTDLDAFKNDIMTYINSEDPDLVDEYFDQNRTEFVKPILYSYNAEGSANYVVYYYFDFANAALAADYYNDAEDKYGNELVTDVTKKTLLGLIPAEIDVEVEQLTASTIMGNYITELTSTDDGVQGTYNMGVGAVSNTTPGKEYSDINRYLKSFLRKTIPKTIEDEPLNAAGENVVLDTFLSRDAVDNIVDWDRVNDEGVSDIISETYTLNGKNVKVIVTQDPTYTINNNGRKETYLLITTGDVIIESGSYVCGLIISRGNIKIGQGVTIEADDGSIEDVFRNAAMYKTADKGELFSKLFRGYDYERKVGEAIDIRNYMIDLNSMFTYENWSRQ